MLSPIMRRVFFALGIFAGAGALVAVLLSLTPDYEIKLTFAQRVAANLKTLFTFDYAYTVDGREPIAAVLLDRGLKSFTLIAGAMVVVFILGTPAGIMAALKRESRFWKIWTNAVYALSAMPSLVWASLLMLLVTQWFQFVPIYDQLGDHSEGSMRALIYLLPILALAFGDGILADVVRVLREETEKALEQDYVRALRARNVGLWRHLRRSLVIPLTAVLAGKISLLIAGTIVVENIFNWRGLGYQILAAVRERGAHDYPLLLAATMLFVGVIIALNLAGEVAAIASDPRLRKP